jgi:hypothetical protein
VSLERAIWRVLWIHAGWVIGALPKAWLLRYRWHEFELLDRRCAVGMRTPTWLLRVLWYPEDRLTGDGE